MTDHSDDKHDRLDERLMARLAQAIKPITPDASARERMRSEILMHTGTCEAEVVRAGEGKWRELLHGVRVKTLHLDRKKGIQTSLFHLDPGSHIPPHSHTQDEECLVLEGSITHRDRTYRMGDFMYARSHVKHDKFYTEEGALLLIRSELVPETNRLTRFLYRLFRG